MSIQDQDGGVSRDCGPRRIIASALGGILTSLAMTPLDVVKVRMQSASKHSNCFLYCNGLMDHLCACANGVTVAGTRSNPWFRRRGNFKSFWEALSTIVKTEGILSLWSGLSPTLAMALPQTVIYYSLNDWLKYRINLCYISNECQVYQNTIFVNIVPPVVGIVSRVFSVFTISPLELMRTKLQSKPMTIQSFYETASSTVTQGGIRSLWTGVGPTLLRDVPFSAIFWYTYDYSKNRHRQTRVLASADEEVLATLEFPVAFFYGATAGFIAGAITHPFDVVKTHRQLELGEALFGQKTYSKSTWKALQQLYKQKGVVALFSGELYTEAFENNYSISFDDLRIRSGEAESSEIAPRFSSGHPAILLPYPQVNI
ncbi:Solute carrier family 25 member 40 [Taenia solium]|eukprot:TsM_000837900 transcript=TsM_000837900 gene=TsM_000837900